MTAVPAASFGPNGFVAPTEADILAGVTSDINAAFGGNVNPGLTTPQGQIATSITAAIGDANDQFLALSNGVDPAFASGRLQDAIGRLYFLTRNPAVSTVVEATCIGLAGVVIPVGALAQAADGNFYTCTQAGTIPVGGSVVLPFACQATGPIICAAGSLQTIYQAIPGWDTITNVAAGIVGNAVETAAEFELRRKQSVALNSVGPVDSILGAVLSVPGVIDAYVIDNPTGAPVTVGGVTLAAHSVYVAASGGAAQAVAQAIWTKKPPGCAYNGNTTQTVYDPNPLYATPPAYPVTYQTPTALSIYFAVSIPNTLSVPANALALVQAAILNAFSGGDGGPRARIGATIFASRFYAAVAMLGAWAQIISIFVGTSASPTANDMTVDIDQIPTLSSGAITLSLV
jgi:hypothetical protein